MRVLQTTGGKDVPNIVNKTCALLQTTGGKDVPNIVFMPKSYRTSPHGNQTINTHNRTTQNEQDGPHQKLKRG